MNNVSEYPRDYLDDAELTYDGPFDVEFEDDAYEKTTMRRRKESARRKLERRAESRWLRDQMVDWDDWND